jgi:hypothetical protein
MNGHLNKDWWRWKFTKSLNRFIDQPDDQMAEKLHGLVREFTRHYAHATQNPQDIPYLERTTANPAADTALVCWLRDFGRTG